MEYVTLGSSLVLLVVLIYITRLQLTDADVDRFEATYGTVLCLCEKEYLIYSSNSTNRSYMRLEYRMSTLSRRTKVLYFKTPYQLTVAEPQLQSRVLVTAARQRGVTIKSVINCDIVA